VSSARIAAAMKILISQFPSFSRAWGNPCGWRLFLLSCPKGPTHT
jgi:hypothetical protein